MSLTPDYSSRQILPRGTSTLALWWFIAALVMLFGATLVGYTIIRVARAGAERAEITGIPAIPLHTYHMPAGLWISTLVVIAASITIQLALRAVQRERQYALRRWSGVTLVLGILFCLIQAPSLWTLLTSHFEMLQASGQYATRNGTIVTNTPMLGLIFMLILLHALHVVGGIIYLIMVQVGAVSGRFDHESHAPVKHAAIYWHFLDIVWILMFFTLRFLG
ncbi:MAG TPA: cytochrome c oxidase subunit 3 [Tepidisphaeraceae bacterium]|nr:cytochrome c oxidase subunit 3 [Tepidisphaeraceae bacterium]